MKVWVVEALRFGDRENHSYVVGVFSNKPIAHYAAEIEEAWRGGKYQCEVSSFEILDKPDKEKLDWFKCTDPKFKVNNQ